MLLSLLDFDRFYKRERNEATGGNQMNPNNIDRGETEPKEKNF